MSNEIQTNEPSVMDLFAAPATSEVDQQQLSSIATTSYVPSLAIAYGTSDSVKKTKIASPGDFTLGGMTCLGDTIEMCVLDWRFHAVLWDGNSNSTEAEIFHFRENGPQSGNPEWVKFIGQPTKVKQEVKQGADMFVWLPRYNMFGSFFMKGSLTKFLQPLITAAHLRLARVSTSYQEAKRSSNSWYDLIITELSERIDPTKIPEDLFKKYMSIFKNPVKGVEEVTFEGPARVR